ncbi:MAG: cytochrome d ubiquinol oxidase subunit II [Muribaculaceae bacterium]|nr:cytochrome d ubiquinol oxidase subunit II [Muribaculaceae bacterium]
MTLSFLQNYWWLLISVLGALLVMMLFVQGGQSMLFQARTAAHRSIIINSLGSKWELTFTTLVVFGGAFFASFPLFYSTSFGGAYWLWMLILSSFVLQAVSYEYRRKKGNLYGVGTYDIFLFINGCLGCILLGVAVGTMIWGAEFTVAKSNLLDPAAPVISTWDNPSRGLEAILSWRNLLLGFTILFLARVQGAIYMLDTTDGDREFQMMLRKRVLCSGVIFVTLFIIFAVVLLISPAYRVGALGHIEAIPYGFLDNLVTLWWAGVAFVVGTVLVLCGIAGVLVFKGFRHGAWYTGLGTVLVVMSLFWIIGYNGTAYYPSITDPESSLTIANSSSSIFTLTVMSYVSLAIPFVLAYIIYVWRAMSHKETEPASY